jgi:hypothetical protein
LYEMNWYVTVFDSRWEDDNSDIVMRATYIESI